MIKQLKENLVFVTGNERSAIYDFLTEKVYSLNKNGTDIIIKYLNLPEQLTSEENEFLNKLFKLFEVSSFDNLDYKFSTLNEKKLDFAWLEVTQNCMNRCIHCYEGEKHSESKEVLSFEEWKKIINELFLLGCNSIQFIGGEPSMYSKLPELIEFAKEKGIKNVSIFTNLYNISDDLFKVIVDKKVHIHFSIYGSTGEIHDRITQKKGSFNRMLKNIKTLLSKNVKLTAHIIIMKENEEQREQIYSWLSKLGIDSIRYDEIRKVFGGCQSKHLVKNSKVLMCKPNFSANKKWFEKAYYCNTCWYGKLVVSTNGNVYPCEFERNIVYGNIKKSTLFEILNNDIVEKYWHWSFDKVEYCKKCEYRFACKDCRPLAYAENGCFTEKNPRCKYNPYLGKWN